MDKVTITVDNKLTKDIISVIETALSKNIEVVITNNNISLINLSIDNKTEHIPGAKDKALDIIKELYRKYNFEQMEEYNKDIILEKFFNYKDHFISIKIKKIIPNMSTIILKEIDLNFNI